MLDILLFRQKKSDKSFTKNSDVESKCLDN